MMLFIEAHSISAYFIPNDILSCQGLFLFKEVYFANIASFFFFFFFFLNYPISETLSTLCFVLNLLEVHCQTSVLGPVRDIA